MKKTIIKEMRGLPLPDQLIHNTVRLTYEIESPENELPKDGTATGFFCALGGSGNERYSAIVTNKHVAKDAVGDVEFTLTFHDDQGRPLYGEKKTFKERRERFLGHPDERIDLAAALLRDEVSYGSIILGHPEDWADAAYMKSLTAIEEILMVGYPQGIWDKVHNLPIVRRGITATAPYIDHNGRPEFLIDCACFPGSSGSPVFFYSPGQIVSDQRGNTFMRELRFKLLGVLSGYKAREDDQRITYNLGHVIKAAQLKGFEEDIERVLHLKGTDLDEELEKLYKKRIANYKSPED